VVSSFVCGCRVLLLLLLRFIFISRSIFFSPFSFVLYIATLNFDTFVFCFSCFLCPSPSGEGSALGTSTILMHLFLPPKPPTDIYLFICVLCLFCCLLCCTAVGFVCISRPFPHHCSIARCSLSIGVRLVCAHLQCVDVCRHGRI